MKTNYTQAEIIISIIIGNVLRNCDKVQITKTKKIDQLVWKIALEEDINIFFIINYRYLSKGVEIRNLVNGISLIYDLKEAVITKDSLEIDLGSITHSMIWFDDKVPEPESEEEEFVQYE